MPDDPLILQTLTDYYRDALADAVLTVAQVKAIRTTAIAALVSGTTIISLNFEGGGHTSQVNCNPALVAAACKTALAEVDQDDIGTGTTHIDLSTSRIET